MPTEFSELSDLRKHWYRAAVSSSLELPEDIVWQRRVKVVWNDERTRHNPNGRGSRRTELTGRNSATARPPRTTTRSSPASTRSRTRVWVILELLQTDRAHENYCSRHAQLWHNRTADFKQTEKHS